MYIVDLLRKRAFFLRKYVNRGMAFHRLVVVASLPATFPTLGRGHPNMTEQAALLTRVNLGQQTLYEVSMGGSPLSGLVGGLAKARQVGFDKTNKNVEDLLHSRPRGQHVVRRAKHESTFPLCICGARAQSARGLLDPCIFPRDKLD